MMNPPFAGMIVFGTLRGFTYRGVHALNIERNLAATLFDRRDETSPIVSGPSDEVYFHFPRENSQEVLDIVGRIVHARDIKGRDGLFGMAFAISRNDRDDSTKYQQAAQYLVSEMDAVLNQLAPSGQFETDDFSTMNIGIAGSLFKAAESITSPDRQRLTPAHLEDRVHLRENAAHIIEFLCNVEPFRSRGVVLSVDNYNTNELVVPFAGVSNTALARMQQREADIRHDAGSQMYKYLAEEAELNGHLIALDNEIHDLEETIAQYEGEKTIHQSDIVKIQRRLSEQEARLAEHGGDAADVRRQWSEAAAPIDGSELFGSQSETFAPVPQQQYELPPRPVTPAPAPRPASQPYVNTGLRATPVSDNRSQPALASSAAGLPRQSYRAPSLEDLQNQQRRGYNGGLQSADVPEPEDYERSSILDSLRSILGRFRLTRNHVIIIGLAMFATLAILMVLDAIRADEKVESALQVPGAAATSQTCEAFLMNYLGGVQKELRRTKEPVRKVLEEISGGLDEFNDFEQINKICKDTKELKFGECQFVKPRTQFGVNASLTKLAACYFEKTYK